MCVLASMHTVTFSMAIVHPSAQTYVAKDEGGLHSNSLTRKQEFATIPLRCHENISCCGRRQPKKKKITPIMLIMLLYEYTPVQYCIVSLFKAKCEHIALSPKTRRRRANPVKARKQPTCSGSIFLSCSYFILWPSLSDITEEDFPVCMKEKRCNAPRERNET